MGTQNRFADSSEARETGNEDLSAQIIGAVERNPGDRITCLRVSGNYYRCNWWAAVSTSGYDNPLMAGLLVTTHRVRQSRLLHVTKPDDKLVIAGMNEMGG